MIVPSQKLQQLYYLENIYFYSNVHKSDINTGKKRCGTTKHFLECYTSEGKFENLKIQLTESVNVPDNLLEQKL